jgi:AAA domain
MIDLKRIIRGKVERPSRVLIYGMDGIGKTRFSCYSPEPFVIDANRGSLDYDVQRVFPDSWEEVKEWISSVESGSVKCQTLVLDSLTDLEKLCHVSLFESKGTTVTEYERGFGNGDELVTLEWRRVIAQLERIWSRGVGIIFTAHVKVTSFKDPAGPDFNRFVLSLRDKLAGQLREWNDFVLFAREEVVTVSNKGKAKATTTGTRWAYTRRCPEYDAKARHSSLFPERVPLSWKDFDGAVRSDDAALRKSLDEMLNELGDPSITATVNKYIKEFPQQLVESHNRVTVMLEKRHAKNESQQAQPQPQANQGATAS